MSVKTVLSAHVRAIYSSLANARSDDDIRKKVTTPHLEKTVAYVARVRTPSKFGELVHKLKDLPQINPNISEENVRTAVVGGVIEAMRVRPLEESMEMWTRAERHGPFFEPNDIRVLAETMRKDELNIHKQEIADNLLRWRTHTSFRNHPDLVRRADFINEWQAMNPEECRVHFHHFCTVLLPGRTTPLDENARRSVGLFVQESDRFRRSSDAFLPLSLAVLQHYAAFGLKEDALFFLKLLLPSLNATDRIDAVATILEHFATQPTAATDTTSSKATATAAVKPRVSAPQITQHLQFLESLRDEVTAAVTRDADVVSVEATVLLQAAIVRNLTRKFLADDVKGVRRTVNSKFDLRSTERALIRSHAVQRFRDTVQQAGTQIVTHSAVSPSAVARSVSHFFDAVVDCLRGLASEHDLVVALRLTEELRTGALSLPLRMAAGTPAAATTASASAASTTVASTAASMPPPSGWEKLIDAPSSSKKLVRISLATYANLLKFAYTTIGSRDSLTLLVVDGIDAFLDHYDRRPTPSKTRVPFPSVDKLLAVSSEAPPAEPLSIEAMQYVAAHMSANQRMGCHPEWALNWLRLLRKHHTHVLPLPMSTYYDLATSIAREHYNEDLNEHIARRLTTVEPLLQRDHQRLQESITKEPHIVAAWFLKNLIDKDGVQGAMSLSFTIPFFEPLARSVVTLNVSEHAERVRYFETHVLRRTLDFLRKQLHIQMGITPEDLQGADEALLEQEEQLWQRQVLQNTFVLRKLADLFMAAGLVDEAVAFIQSVHGVDVSKRAAMVADVRAYQSIITRIPFSAPIRHRSPDKVDNLVMQLVSASAVEASKKPKTERAAVKPVVTPEMVDAVILSKVTDGAYGVALDKALELYQQHGVAAKLSLLQTIYVATQAQKEKHEMSRLHNVLAYLHPAEAELLAQASVDADGNSVLPEQSSFHPHNTGMLRALQAYRKLQRRSAKKALEGADVSSGSGEGDWF